jgi:hypothetical protein
MIDDLTAQVYTSFSQIDPGGDMARPKSKRTDAETEAFVDECMELIASHVSIEAMARLLEKKNLDILGKVALSLAFTQIMVQKDRMFVIKTIKHERKLQQRRLDKLSLSRKRKRRPRRAK